MKAGEPLADDAAIEVRGRDHPWVSRGGVKLAHALDHFAIDPGGVTALDIGASTGGFTDVLLTRGARRVYAVDVGHGQLAWKLRQDARVVVYERVNARNLGREQIPEPVDLIVCDASFIGLATVLPAPLALAAERGGAGGACQAAIRGRARARSARAASCATRRSSARSASGPRPGSPPNPAGG